MHTASFGTRPATHWSPRPNGWVASSTKHTTSTSPMVPWAVALSRVPSAVRGLWIPGVSTNTTWASGRVSTPMMRVRVVWGLSEVIATLVPTMRFTSVDFPTLGRPTKVTKPERISASVAAGGGGSKAWSAVDADPPDAPARPPAGR